MTRLFILANTRIYRDGLATVLSDPPALTVAGSASFSDDYLLLCDRLNPDVVLCDDYTNVEAIQRLAHRRPDLKVIALGVAETVDAVLPLAEAGIVAYVPKEASLRDLQKVIMATVRGELHCSPVIAQALMRRVAQPRSSKPPLQTHALTSRETEIVRLLAKHFSNKEIANVLHISPATVKQHVHHILSKLRVRKRAELIGLL
jgi:DNA-binding NarL/FixJ family response regulator